MKRFQIDCYAGDEEFPANSYVTNNENKLSIEIGKLTKNVASGIGKIIIYDSLSQTEKHKLERQKAQNPKDLDLV